MTYIKLTLALIALVFLQACEDRDTYPISGQECGPNDPVQEMTVPDCTPTGVSGL